MRNKMLQPQAPKRRFLWSLGRNGEQDQRRYSPPPCVGAIKGAITGKPDPKHISTSYAERQNLNIRMHTRRFTRLTNAFSKKVENHALAVALFAMYYNFVRIHKTLRVTPAMAAGVTDKLWDVADMVAVLEKWEAAQVFEAREKAINSVADYREENPNSN